LPKQLHFIETYEITEHRSESSCFGKS